jgi:hypothetical protein
MSSKVINAVISLIAGRPEDAREVLRSPELKIKSISDVQVRLAGAIEGVKCGAVKQSLRELLQHTLRLERPTKLIAEIGEDADTATLRAALDNAYLQGVTAVEDLVERMIRTCEEQEQKKDS